MYLIKKGLLRTEGCFGEAGDAGINGIKGASGGLVILLRMGQQGLTRFPPAQNMNRLMLMFCKIPIPTMDVIMDVPP